MVDRCGKERIPDQCQHSQNRRPTQVDDGYVRNGNRQNIAKQQAHQIDAYPGHERQGNKPQGQRGMRQQSQQGIRRQRRIPLQEHQRQRHGTANDEHRQSDIEFQQESHGNTQKRRMGKRIAKIGKSAPYDKTSKRGSDQGHPDACDNGSCEEIVKHGLSPACCEPQRSQDLCAHHRHGDARHPHGNDP